jgi:hypothetical protein
MLNSVNFYAAHAASVFVAINVLFCIIHYKKLDSPFRRLFYFLILNLVIEILASLFIEFGINNLPLLHIYTLAEFILFSYFYKSIIKKPSTFHTIYWYFIIGGSAFIIFNSIFLQSIFDFNSIAKTFVQISIIAYAVIYFYHLVDDPTLSPSTSKSLRLVNSAIITYYSGSLFIFMFNGISLGDDGSNIIFWIFNSLLNIIFHLLIFYALWRLYSKKAISSL